MFSARYRLAHVSALIFGLALLWPTTTLLHAYPFYADEFYGRYTEFPRPSDGTECRVCHKSIFGAGPRNPYGADFEAFSFDLATIEPADSDGDGVTNLQEATAKSQPGRTPTVFIVNALLARTPAAIDPDVDGTAFSDSGQYLADASDIVAAQLREAQEATYVSIGTLLGQSGASIPLRK